MRVALDTSAYSAMTSGDTDVAAIVQFADEIHLPLFVLAELRAGFALGAKAADNERRLARFLGDPGVFLLLPTEQTSFGFARLMRQLRRQGTPIGAHDIWIAALVLEHGLSLCTRDGDFRHLPQLDLV
jgi:tRNA(fMet)-specific endonuclease VapC